MKGRRFALGVLVAVIVLALDQASKSWVLHGLALAARGPLVLLPVFLIPARLVGRRLGALFHRGM